MIYYTILYMEAVKMPKARISKIKIVQKEKVGQDPLGIQSLQQFVIDEQQSFIENRAAVQLQKFAHLYFCRKNYQSMITNRGKVSLFYQQKYLDLIYIEFYVRKLLRKQFIKPAFA